MAQELSEDDAHAPITEGDNGITQDVFRYHLKRLIEANGERDGALADRKTVRKAAKLAGLTLEHVDTIIEMLGWEPAEIREFIDTLLRYMDLAELLPKRPPEAQLQLFPEKDPEERSKEDWALKGFLAAVSGKGVAGKPPPECPADRMQHWMEGWHHGQETNAAKLAVVK